MRHHATIWTDATYQAEAVGHFKPDGEFVLGTVLVEYREWLTSRSRPVSAETWEKYRKSILSFCRSLADAGDPPVLGSFTPAAANRWMKAQRDRGLAEEGIASRLAAVKAFTRGFVWKQLELTHWDLLEKCARVSVEATPKPRLTDDAIRSVLRSFPDSYDGERDRAMVTLYLATGCRLSELLNLATDSIHRMTGEFEVVGKGSKARPCKLGQDSLKVLRHWLRVRVGEDGGALWTTAEGKPLTFWGAQDVFRRIRKRHPGLAIHAHLLRHTFAQGAIENGAERAVLQDALGHTTDAMTRRYSKLASERKAAAEMPRWSLVG